MGLAGWWGWLGGGVGWVVGVGLVDERREERRERSRRGERRGERGPGEMRGEEREVRER